MDIRLTNRGRHTNEYIHLAGTKSNLTIRVASTDKKGEELSSTHITLSEDKINALIYGL